MPDDYKPHRWEFDRLNSFWAHCNCGYSGFGFLPGATERKMNRHVRRETENDYRAAQIENMKRGNNA